MNTELQNLAEKLGIATKFLDAGKNRKFTEVSLKKVPISVMAL